MTEHGGKQNLDSEKARAQSDTVLIAAGLLQTGALDLTGLLVVMTRVFIVMAPTDQEAQSPKTDTGRMELPTSVIITTLGELLCIPSVNTRAIAVRGPAAIVEEKIVVVRDARLVTMTTAVTSNHLEELIRIKIKTLTRLMSLVEKTADTG